MNSRSIDIDSQPEIEAKLKTLDELVELRARHQSGGETVVTTNGAFDILHLGHMVTLYESARQGDVLIVGVNSDTSVQSYKSPDRPINSQALRMRAVAAIGCVDYVFTFDDQVPVPWLRRLRPDIHTNSITYGEHPVERETVEEYGGTMHFTPVVEGLSTSGLIRKILTIYGQPE